MKFLFDLFPVILFFVTFKLGEKHATEFASTLQSLIGGDLDIAQAPVLAATFVAIVASLIQVGLVYLRGKKPEPMLWISLVIIIVFGTLTIWLHNAMFIKWKPTILYWIFASILTYGTCTRKNFVQKLLGHQIQMPAKAWDVMQNAWIGFFSIVGVLNLAVAYLCSTATWVNFKLFGLMGLTLIFTIAVGVWIAKNTSNCQNTEN